MKQPTVFVTYNSGNDFEETLAVRLHTIGAVNGFTMLMPDRFSPKNIITPETQYRIRSSDYFILFSTSKLTSIVKQEVEEAFRHLKDKSRILIVYNKYKNLQHNENCTELYVDTALKTPEQILNAILEQLKQKQHKKPSKQKEEDNSMSVIAGILLIGLGLFALDSLFNSKKK